MLYLTSLFGWIFTNLSRLTFLVLALLAGFTALITDLKYYLLFIIGEFAFLAYVIFAWVPCDLVIFDYLWFGYLCLSLTNVSYLWLSYLGFTLPLLVLTLNYLTLSFICLCLVISESPLLKLLSFTIVFGFLAYIIFAHLAFIFWLLFPYRYRHPGLQHQVVLFTWAPPECCVFSALLVFATHLELDMLLWSPSHLVWFMSTWCSLRDWLVRVPCS